MLVTSNRAAKRDEQIYQYALMYKAARWLGQWNYSRLAALQEVTAKRLGLSFGALRRMVDEEAAHRPWYYTGQTIPLGAVPEELKNAAEAYNRSVFKDWPERMAMTEADYEVSAERAQIACLEEALLTVTRVPSDAVIADIATTVGTSFDIAEAVANALYARAAYDVNRLIEPDYSLEEVLPAVY